MKWHMKSPEAKKASVVIHILLKTCKNMQKVTKFYTYIFITLWTGHYPLFITFHFSFNSCNYHLLHIPQLQVWQLLYFLRLCLTTFLKKKKRMAKLSRNVFPVVSRPGQTENVNAFSLVMLSNVFGLYSNHAMPNDNHKGTALNSVFLVWFFIVHEKSVQTITVCC